jgi:ADP-ribose pyrophosphatase YjhB (NUDIX family)
MRKPFDYCPACATALNGGDEPHEHRCPSCGRSWYLNAAPTAGAAIFRDGQVLVTKRGMEPEKGRFDVPGGFLSPGENPIEGLRRELREELQIEVDVSMDDVVQMVPHAYGDDGDWVLAIGYFARLVSGEITPGSDVEEAHWITEDEVEKLDFAWEHDKELVRKAFEHAKEKASDRN